MKTIKTLALSLAVVGFMSANSVHASFVTVGEPQQIGSWLQNWQESGVGSFTEIDAILRSGTGVSFKPPGLGAWSGQSWTTTFTSPTLGIIQGPARTTLNFATSFTSDKTTPLSFDLYVWNGNVLKDSGRAIWSGSAWSFGTADAVSGPSAVPEPTTVVAGALLLLPLGMSALRTMRKNRAA